MPDIAGVRNGGVRLSITNSLDILRERLMMEMERNRNIATVSIVSCQYSIFVILYFSPVDLVARVRVILEILVNV